MNLRSFLVLGGESTGTRVLTKILMLAGCEGSNDHVQPWDDRSPEGELIVWRRSLPHARRWPDIASMADQLRFFGYDVTALFITRDWHAASRSQVLAGHVSDVAAAEKNLAAAHVHALRGIAMAHCPWRGVTYESLSSRGTRQALLEALGLPVSEIALDCNLTNENEKHYAR